MSDPMSIAVLAGAAVGGGVGGAAGKFTELAFQQGKEWVNEYFYKHRPTAIQKAQQNTSEFLIEMSNRVSKLENTKVKDILEDPEFSSLLQKAVLTSAQTDNKEKHKLLADLLSERLKCDSESNFTVGCKMAVNVLEYLTSHHLQILAFICELRYVMTSEFPSYEALKLHLDKRLTPYLNIQISSYDLMHLESLSCTTHEFMYKNNVSGLLVKKSKYYSDEYLQTEIGGKINSIWNSPMEGMTLTISGLILGWNVIADKFSEPPFSERFIG
ncbi:MAG: hypothetical protein RSC33_07320 [Vagococcus sp.]